MLLKSRHDQIVNFGVKYIYKKLYLKVFAANTISDSNSNKTQISNNIKFFEGFFSKSNTISDIFLCPFDKSNTITNNKKI